jgi:hypothetical protein
VRGNGFCHEFGRAKVSAGSRGTRSSSVSVSLVTFFSYCNAYVPTSVKEKRRPGGKKMKSEEYKNSVEGFR